MFNLGEGQRKVMRELLQSKETITSEYIYNKTGLSIRTIKTYIKELRIVGKEYHFKIVAKRGVGYRLLPLGDKGKTNLHLMMTEESYSNVPSSQKERIDYIIRKLLSIDYSISIDDLANELFVSKNTMYTDIQHVQKVLQTFSLSLDLNNKNGACLMGSELNKRACTNEYFFQSEYSNPYAHSNRMFSSESNQKELRFIREALLNVLNKNSIWFSDISIQNMVIHIMVMLRRCRFYQYIDDKDVNLVDEDLKIEYKAASLLTEKLEQYLGVILPDAETRFLALHISSKSIQKNTELEISSNNKVNEVINKIFISLKEMYGIELCKENDIVHYLQMHIPAMVHRVKMNLTLRNPMIQLNLQRYPYAFELSLVAANIINESYNIELDMNEISYIMLYFNLGINRVFLNEKKRIFLVSGYGRPETILTINSLMENFGSYIASIVPIDLYELEFISVQPSDLIITTLPLSSNQNAPTLYVNQNIEDYYQEILKLLKSEDYRSLDIKKITEKCLISIDFEAKSKQDVYEEFRLMLKHSKFSDSNEEIVNSISELGNEVGNQIVCLHTLCRNKEPLVSFIKLRQPIIWNREQVKFVFLLSFQGNVREMMILSKFISQIFMQNIQIKRLYHKFSDKENN